MTIQIPDSVLLRGVERVLVAWDGRGMFHPAEHGLDPDWGSTACYRGYVCTYAIGNGFLSLRNVLFHNLRGFNPSEPTELFGSPPAHTDGSYVAYSFPKLDAAIRFSGALLVASDWTGSEWAWLHPAELYETVFELTFQDGRFGGVFNRSESAEEVRRLPRKWEKEGFDLLQAWEKERFKGSYISPPR